MKRKLKILTVEDAPADADLILIALNNAGIDNQFKRVESETAFRREIEIYSPDIILSDFTLPSFDGMTALAIARNLRPQTPFLFVSGTMGEELVIDALKNGATDYVLKTNLARLGPAVLRAIREAEERSARQQAESVIKKSQQQYESLINKIDGIVWEMELPAFRYSFVSLQAEQTLGYPIKSWLDDADFFKRHIHPEDRGRVLNFYRKLPSSNVPGQIDYRMFTHDGRIVWLRDYVHMTLNSGIPAKLQGIIVDITTIKEQERKIARLNRVYAVLSGINSAIVRVKNQLELFDESCRIAVLDGGFRSAAVFLINDETGNNKLVANDGMNADFLLQINLDSAAHSPDGQRLALESLRDRNPVVFNSIATESDPLFKLMAHSHGVRSLALLPLTVDDVFLGALALTAGEANFFNHEEIRLLDDLSTDISYALDHIKKQERIDYLAYYDDLTGLPNRTLFYDRLAQLLHSSSADEKKVALVLVDLVNFKLVNDSIGQHAGNQILREFAHRLEKALADDATVARVAGDVFALASVGSGDIVDVTQPLVDKIQLVCEAVIRAEQHEVRVYVKMGIAVFPADGANADTLFINAEAALKKVKKSVEISMYYSPEMNAHVSESLVLRNKLRRALEDQQFVLHLQPVKNMQTGEISGAEALVRWNDPETGLVLPGQFVPLLEETGMILDLGRWVLEKAIALNSQWTKQGLNPPRISVNVSAIQLRHKGFVNDVVNAVDKSGGTGLNLEITESVMMEDVPKNIGKLRVIRDMGMEIAIDDFGTGYSSLSYLSKLPINALKVDRAFVVDMVDNPNNMALVSMIISLAHALKLKVVAEGVENEAQSEMLKTLHCDMMQGYHFHRPIPTDDFKSLLSQTAANSSGLNKKMH